MSDLDIFIKTTRDSRELRRALAVKNTLAGHPWQEVVEELGVCWSFIGKWRQIYAEQGIDGLKLGHKGSAGYLTADERAEVLRWLQKLQHWNVGSLRAYIQRRYGVVYQSRQSYYALLHEAKLSWKKTQKRNPKADPQQVMEARETIKKKRLRRLPRFYSRRQSSCLWMNAISCGAIPWAMFGDLGASGLRFPCSTNGNAKPITER